MALILLDCDCYNIVYAFCTLMFYSMKINTLSLPFPSCTTVLLNFSPIHFWYLGVRLFVQEWILIDVFVSSNKDIHTYADEVFLFHGQQQTVPSVIKHASAMGQS